MNAADNAGGWPDADKPGVPLNPERDGWHWLLVMDGETPAYWQSLTQSWDSAHYMLIVPPEPDAPVEYIGIALTPSEIAAREAAAAVAMREMAALEVEWESPIRDEVVADYIDCTPRYEPSNRPNKKAAKRANAIRALPLPLMPNQQENNNA